MFEKLIGINSLIVVSVVALAMISGDVELTKTIAVGLIGYLGGQLSSMLTKNKQ